MAANKAGVQAGYRYELIQDLRSQLLEEELRNRDRNAALIALDQEMERYRPYLGLSPDEALERSRTAGPDEKKLLERLAGVGWGPIQLYFQLSPQQQAALRAGQDLRFSQEPAPGEPLLPADLARGVLQTRHDVRFVRASAPSKVGSPGPADPQPRFAREDEPDTLPPSAVPETRAVATLWLHETELGRFGFGGCAEVRLGDFYWGSDTGPYAVGLSPTAFQPGNAVLNAKLAREPALQRRVTVVLDGRRQTVDGSSAAMVPAEANTGASVSRLPSTVSKISSADLLEALHHATGLPTVADFYTRLYGPDALSARDQPLFDTLNQLADAMRLRWNHEDGWLRFRSSSFYNDRLKEVPNRLLTRWAVQRQRNGHLSLDDLCEIAGLTDAQLDARDMAEGARELWDLAEWGLACNRGVRPHLRWMVGLTPVEREKVQRSPGLRFTELSLPQQQQFITLVIGDKPNAIDSLEELATAAVQIDYAQPGEFEWKPREKPRGAPGPLSPVRAPTREATLAAAQRLDPQADASQIQPTRPEITLLYYWGTTHSKGAYQIHTTGPDDTGVGRWWDKSDP